jgi:hypothetical protein
MEFTSQWCVDGSKIIPKSKKQTLTTSALDQVEESAGNNLFNKLLLSGLLV